MNTFPELSAPEDAEILWKGIKGKNKGGKKIQERVAEESWGGERKYQN